MSEKLSVLLVEDDINDVDVVKRAVNSVYPPIFDLYHAAKFRDAIQMIKQSRFQVVILDLGLPDSVGLNGVERLMGLIPQIPVIVLTGTEDEDIALRGIELGAQEFLSKQEITPRMLVRKIRHAAKRKDCSIRQTVGEVTNQDRQSLARLSEMVMRNSSTIQDSTASLVSTDLSEEQLRMVKAIEESNQESIDAAGQFNEYSSTDDGRTKPVPDFAEIDVTT